MAEVRPYSDLEVALARLEQVLNNAAATIATVFRPGIDANKVTALLADVGLAPTEEVTTWFGWHDGAGATGMPSATIEVIPGAELYDLAYLCGEYRQAREVAREVSPGVHGFFDGEQIWPSTFLPILRLFGKGYIAVNLADDVDGHTTVHLSWHDDDPEARLRVAWPSIASFVEEALDCYASGTYEVLDGIVQGPTIDHPKR